MNNKKLLFKKSFWYWTLYIVGTFLLVSFIDWIIVNNTAHDIYTVCEYSVYCMFAIWIASAIVYWIVRDIKKEKSGEKAQKQIEEFNKFNDYVTSIKIANSMKSKKEKEEENLKTFKFASIFMGFLLLLWLVMLGMVLENLLTFGVYNWIFYTFGSLLILSFVLITLIWIFEKKDSMKNNKKENDVTDKELNNGN